MDERTMQFRVGLMVLATLLITGILVVMFGEMPKIIYGEYKLYITFDQAPGVTEGTPVRKSGILIGRVKSVRFSDDDTKVEVTVSIQEQYHLRRYEICRVASNILGDASLEFIRSPDKSASKELLKNGDRLQGLFIPDPNQLIQNIQGGFSATIESVQDTSRDFSVASKKLTETLTRLSEVIEDNREGFKRAVDQANDIMDSTRNVIGDKDSQEQLRNSIKQLPDMIKDMRQTVATVDRNLRNIEGFTRPFGERGEMLIDNLDRGTQRLDQLVSEMLKFSQALNSSQGTVGQLVNNPELYQRMNRAAKNIEDLSRQLKPIMDDARVFSDKIARHPESLGVRGAVQKSIGVK